MPARGRSAVPGPRHHRGAAVVLLTVTVLATGCGPAAAPRPVPGRAVADPVPAADRALVLELVAAGNRAAGGGPAAQVAFLRDTQDAGAPFPPERCFAGAATLWTRVVERTLRPTPGWTPAPGAPRPDGAVYAVAASTTALVDGAAVREDVASKHVVLRGGRAFGYAPCPD